LKRDCVGTSTAMIDRERVGPFLMRENFAACDDLALWLSLTKQGHDILFLTDDLARQRVTARKRDGACHGREKWKAFHGVAKLPRGQSALAVLCTSLHRVWRMLF